MAYNTPTYPIAGREKLANSLQETILILALRVLIFVPSELLATPLPKISRSATTHIPPGGPACVVVVVAYCDHYVKLATVAAAADPVALQALACQQERTPAGRDIVGLVSDDPLLPAAAGSSYAELTHPASPSPHYYIKYSMC